MNEKPTKREVVSRNAAVRYENGGAAKGRKVSLSCPIATARALRAEALKRRVAVSRLLDSILREHLGLPE